MEYKSLPENSPTEEKSGITQQSDTIDIEKRAALSSDGYGTIPSYTNKEGGIRVPQKEEGRGIWISFVQSLVAVAMFTGMAVTLVLVIL